MTKGRKFVPSPTKHGVWYRHLGMPEQMQNRKNGTTTGVMLHCNSADNTAHVECPPIFQERMKELAKNKNEFSRHDNRNAFQNHGAHFGYQLGKHKSIGEMSQHSSDDFVTWGRRNLPEYQNETKSLYREHFTGIDIGLEEALKHRRFSKTYPQPISGNAELSSSTTMWASKEEVVSMPCLQTLANTQEPYLKPNPWRYSFRSHSFSTLP